MTITLDDARYVADQYLLPIGMKLLVGLIIFMFGRWIARAILRGLDRVMERSKMDVSLRKFIGSLAYAMMFVVISIAALDAVGVKTTAIVAVLGAAGLAVGLALQGSLSNFAAGVMLIVLRPYKVNDLVTIGKYVGRVEAIKVFHTILVTGDNREITIPNGQIIAQPIENLTVLGRRRVDLVITLDDTANLAKVRTVIETALASDQRIQQAPVPEIDLAEISSTHAKLHVRPWTSVDQYFKVVPETMERIRTGMEGTGIKYTLWLQAPS